MNINSQVYLKAICKGDSSQNKIAITFDDGPNNKFTTNILKSLSKTNTKAAFFIIGKNIQGNETILKQTADEGHIIGNHSFAHSFGYDFNNVEEFILDTEMAQRKIQAIIRTTPLLFRPPYGISTPKMGRAIKQLNLTTIGWSVRSMDTTLKRKYDLWAKVKSVKGGDIVLFHDSTPFMAEFLEEWIPQCQQNGLEIVGLDELLNIKCYA